MTRALALTEARVWAGPEAGLCAEAVGFGADGRVAAVGTVAQVLGRLPAGATQVRCGHRLVVPGFVDAHVHVRASVAARLTSPGGDIRSAADLLGRLEELAEARPAGAWISVAGLEPQSMIDDLPDRGRLDRAAGDHPVRIRLRSLHGWLLNSAARREACIPGTATDIVTDHSGEVARRLGPVATPEVFEAAAGEWSARLLRDGVVALLDATASNGPADLERLREWHRRGVLRQVPAAFTAAPSPGAAGVKIVPAVGPNLASKLTSALRRAWSRGLPAAIHCVDTDTLGALIEAVESMPIDERCVLRIEHAALCPPDWLERVAALRPVIVTHPGFIAEHGERYLEDPQLPFPDWLYRVGSWLRLGCRVAFGSDSPAGPADPAVSLRAAITRQTAAGRVIGSDERITVWDAMRAMTSEPADASGLCGLGRIVPGGPGMAVVLDGDVEDPEPRLRVANVIAGGEEVQ